jgi:hypothetical protein
MSIYILNMPFAIEKRISISVLPSKMNRRFVWQKAMRIEQYLPNYNASIYLRTECSEREKRSGPNKKKIRNFKSVFDPHRHLRRKETLMRQYNGAGMISP